MEPTPFLSFPSIKRKKKSNGVISPSFFCSPSLEASGGWTASRTDPLPDAACLTLLHGRAVPLLSLFCCFHIFYSQIKETFKRKKNSGRASRFSGQFFGMTY